MLRFVTALVVFVAIMAGQAAAQSFPIPSTWKNQRGSELMVGSGTSDGSFSGQYINQADGFDCKGLPFDVSGRSNGNKVRFVVTWKNNVKSCNSIAVWRGTVTGSTMTTQWELGYVDAGSGTIKVIKGTDIFKRTN